MKKIGLYLAIIGEFFGSLLRFNMWWSIPIIFFLLLFMIFFFIGGHTGVGAFIYPLF